MTGGRASREKGGRTERAIVRLLQERGYFARLDRGRALVLIARRGTIRLCTGRAAAPRDRRSDLVHPYGLDALGQLLI